MMKRLYGTGCYVQSAGVKDDLEVDGFAIAVCGEIGVELARHRARSFETMGPRGDDLSSFDLIVALTPACQRRALDLTRHADLALEYWPDPRPHGPGRGREEKLAAYRQTRDQILKRLVERFGASRTGWEPPP
jgi:arsenate reductase